jgi:hypothetical protein
VCIHCFDRSLVSAYTNETQVSSLVTRTMWLRNSLSSLWYRSKRVYKSRSHCLRFVPTHEHFRNPSSVKLGIIFYTLVHEICGNSHESSEIVKRRLSQIFWLKLWKRSSLTTDGRPLRSSSWTSLRSPIFEYPTPLSYSSLTHYVSAINRHA